MQTEPGVCVRNSLNEWVVLTVGDYSETGQSNAMPIAGLAFGNEYCESDPDLWCLPPARGSRTLVRLGFEKDYDNGHLCPAGQL